MPSPFQLVTARTWQAKSVPRQMAEVQYLQDRDSAEYAKESWKTLRQLMYNDLQNAMDSHDMVSKYGPVNWGTELYMLGALNNRLSALSTVPPYIAQKPTFPFPSVNEVAPLPPPMPMPMPMPMLPSAPVVSPAMPLAPAIAAPLPAIAPVPVPIPPSFVNNVPISIGPTIMGYSIMAVLGPMEALAPAMAHFDIALQRLTAVEGLAEKSAMMGGDGIINLRLVTMPNGDVLAAGEVVKLVPALAAIM